MSDTERYSTGAKLLHAAVFLAVAAYSAYLPYKIFGVSPFTIPADRVLVEPGPPPAVDPYADIPLTVELSPQAKQDFMWCRFCHSFEEGGPHAVGPNLHRVYGRPAASSPGFNYSAAFVEAGRNGLVWDDAQMDLLIADSEAFLGGRHRMRYKAIPDPAVRAEIIAALKSATK